MRWAAAVVISMALLGCSSVHPQAAKVNVRSVSSKELAKTAKSQLGKPYRYGGEDPKQGFDCSGLVWWSFQQLGSAVPRTARLQYSLGRAIKSTDIKPGDLVFFDTAGRAPGHVGVAIDRNYFVHAPSSGGKVRIDSLKNVYWSKHYYGARRVD